MFVLKITFIPEKISPKKISKIITFENATVLTKKIRENLRTIETGDFQKAKIFDRKEGSTVKFLQY